MTERQKKIVEALNLNERDFQTGDTQSDRLKDLEDAVIELAELVGE